MKPFLEAKFGPERGARLYALTQNRLNQLLAQADADGEPRSKAKNKILKNMLLPRIAMYQALQEDGMTQTEALEVMFIHMEECDAPKLRRRYVMMDKLPFAYGLFKFGFTKVTKTCDLWDSEIDTSHPDEFRVTMHRCFWNDTFRKYGCPEMCERACRCDDITYSDLRHIDYHRTQTLGTGGSCCDFVFSKRKH